MLAFKEISSWIIWNNQPRPKDGGDAYSLPVNAEQIMSEDELSHYGLYKILPADDISSGQIVTGTIIVDYNGKPKYKNITQTISLQDAITQKLAALANQRYGIETGGTFVGNMPVPTDRQTAAILTAAYVTAVADPTYSIQWKVTDGVFATLTSELIIVAATAARNHIQACFAKEAEYTAAILALTDPVEIVNYNITLGWPQNIPLP